MSIELVTKWRDAAKDDGATSERYLDEGRLDMAALLKGYATLGRQCADDLEAALQQQGEAVYRYVEKEGCSDGCCGGCMYEEVTHPPKPVVSEGMIDLAVTAVTQLARADGVAVAELEQEQVDKFRAAMKVGLEAALGAKS